MPSPRSSLLLGAERVEVEVLEQLVERAVVVAGVVDHADRDLGREVLRGDEVLPPHLERVHAELGGGLVEHRLDHVGRLGPARAADRVGGNLFVKTPADVGLDARDLVAAAHHERAERRDERREQHVVRAEVGDDPARGAR